MKKKIIRYEIGIDEAGRGPLAGPVAVGVVMVPIDFDWNLIEGVGDSKKVTPKNREAIFGRAQALQKEGILRYVVILGSARKIDTKGISQVVYACVEKALASLAPPTTCSLKLDGSLKAPPQYRNQQTIIRGDAQEKIIGLASILAKVTRDRYMVRIAKKYPQYGFEAHKGYGTNTHRKLIKRYGISPEHRVTFLSRIV
ncbi:MAG TPA: ribonuclease HII [Candidatus Paceibacterota bacterium]|nr:ribonuclease HII [Candidatus Paceibacterota bacterium]